MLSQVHTIDCGVGKNHKDPKFKVGDQLKISKYKNVFVKGGIHKVRTQ